VPYEEHWDKDVAFHKRMSSRGMQLNAIRYCPPEQEHSELWFASRMAQLVYSLEFKTKEVSSGGMFADFDGITIRASDSVAAQ
jgi:hypothetical protein